LEDECNELKEQKVFRYCFVSHCYYGRSLALNPDNEGAKDNIKRWRKRKISFTRNIYFFTG